MGLAITGVLLMGDWKRWRRTARQVALAMVPLTAAGDVLATPWLLAGLPGALQPAGPAAVAGSITKAVAILAGLAVAAVVLRLTSRDATLPAAATILDLTTPGTRTTSQRPHTTAAPGWYPDPHSPALLRWWSGTEWANHTAINPSPAKPTRSR